MSMGKPMANYAAAKRVGDFVFMSGVVAVSYTHLTLPTNREV